MWEGMKLHTGKMETFNHLGQCQIHYVEYPLPVLSPPNCRTPKFSIFSGVTTKKGEISFEQWVFEVRGVLQSHSEAKLWEGIVCSLWEAAVNLL